MGRQKGEIGVAHHIECLGLQTYGRERIEPGFVMRKPVFRYEPATAIHELEVPALLGLLLRDAHDANTVIDRHDPMLLDKELDQLLVEYGPLIWPEPGQGSRDHLRKPQEGTRYPADLIYPRDSTTIKKHLLGMVLCRQTRTDVETFINRTYMKALKYKKRDLNIDNKPWFQGCRFVALNEKIPVRKRRSTGTTTTADEPAPQRARSEEDQTDVDSDTSEDSVMGTKIGCPTRRTSALSPEPSPFKVELRIYRTKPPGQPIGPGPTWSYGSLMFTGKETTCEDFFGLICNQTKADCSFLIFQLPEDMSMDGRVRIDRGSKESEMTYRRTLGILQRARRFPCGPSHRSVELEIGFETVVD